MIKRWTLLLFVIATTTSMLGGEKTKSSNTISGWKGPEAAEIASEYNVFPKFYWNAAWEEKNSQVIELTDEVQEEIVEWGAHFLLKDANSKDRRYLGYLFGVGASKYISPSAELLKKLNKYDVKPSSELRIPNEGVIKHKQTGKDSRLYYVHIIQALPGDKVLVEVGFTSGPLSGGGQRFVLERRKKTWKILWVLERWVS